MPLLHHVLGGPGHCIDPGLVVVDLSHGGLVVLDHGFPDDHLINIIIIISPIHLLTH